MCTCKIKKITKLDKSHLLVKINIHHLIVKILWTALYILHLFQTELLISFQTASLMEMRVKKSTARCILH